MSDTEPEPEDLDHEAQHTDEEPVPLTPAQMYGTRDVIVDGAVTSASLADNAITSAKIKEGTITAAKIEAGSIGARELAERDEDEDEDDA